MIKRLRVKFVVINMAIVTIMLCVIFALVLHFTGENMEQQSLDMMQSVALEPHRMGVIGEGGPHVRLPYFALTVGDGGEVQTSGGGYYDLTDPRLVEKLLSLSAARKTGVLQDYGLRYVRMTTPTAQYIVFADISSEISTMQALVEDCLLIGAASFVAFLVISILLARWAVKPVEAAWQQQRQFVADASHELKTPLTVILSNAQTLASAGDDPALREKLTANILTVSRQMKDLVAKLLHAAQVDQGAESMTFATVDWSDAVRCALLPFDTLFYEQSLTLDSDVEEGIFVRGDGGRLTQVVDILLDNAQKYSVSGGKTAVTLHRQGRRHCLLTVANEGAPLTQQETRDIFKRFYRADTARSRTGSYGLGLSIAETIVTAHHGRIWAESSGGVNTFFVQLPLKTEK